MEQQSLSLTIMCIPCFKGQDVVALTYRKTSTDTVKYGDVDVTVDVGIETDASNVTFPASTREVVPDAAQQISATPCQVVFHGSVVKYGQMCLKACISTTIETQGCT